MRKRFKYACTIIISFILIASISILVNAKTPPNVSLEGSADGIVFIPNDELFLYGEDMIPGDKITGSININNKYSETYKLYMKAERITKEENEDLLKALDLKVIYNDQIIYEGNAAGDSGLSDNIYLGKFDSNKSAKLFAEVYLDGNKINNNYQNKYGEVKWIFTAVREGEQINNEVPSNSIITKIYNGIKTGDKKVCSWVGICFVSLVSTIILGRRIHLKVKEG